MIYLWVKRLQKSDIKNKFYLRFYYAMFVPNPLIIALMFMNIFGIVFDQEFGPYLVALIYPLIIAGVIFAQLILGPLCRSVLKAEQEARE